MAQQAAAMAERDAAATAAKSVLQNETRRAADREAALQAQVQRLERLQYIAKKTALSSESALRDAVTQLQHLQQQHQHCSTSDRSQQQSAATADAQLQTEQDSLANSTSSSGAATNYESNADLGAQAWLMQLVANARDYDSRTQRTGGAAASKDQSSDAAQLQIQQLRQALAAQSLDIAIARQNELKATTQARMDVRALTDRLAAAETNATALTAARQAAKRAVKDSIFVRCDTVRYSALYTAIIAAVPLLSLMQISYINSYSNNCGGTTTVVVTLVVVLVAMVGELKCASLARTVDTLKGRGDLTQALAAARHQLCEESIKRMQSDSNAALHQQLAAEEQARRATALKQVADLQDAIDRRAVCDTVTVPDTAAVACGVTALQLIEQFAGTATKQSARVKELESEVNKLYCLHITDDVSVSKYIGGSNYRCINRMYTSLLMSLGSDFTQRARVDVLRHTTTTTSDVTATAQPTAATTTSITSTQPGATAAGTTTTAAATSTTGAAASAATASSASNASTDSWTLALDSAAVQSMKARADALQRELDASRAQLVICKRDLARAERATAAANTAIEDAHKDAISKAQTDLSAAKQEVEALRVTCDSLKQQLQSRLSIGRAVVGDHGGTNAANINNNSSYNNSNANTVQQQQSQQQQQHQHTSSAHRYSNGLYAMSSSSPDKHQQQHHSGGSTSANNATTTWDNVHMSVEIERLRSIAQERGSQVQVLTAAVQALQTATSYSDSNDNNVADNGSNNHTARSSHRTAATGTHH
eukprot:17661-Heterococcus_DN1.PRE.4